MNRDAKRVAILIRCISGGRDGVNYELETFESYISKLFRRYSLFIVVVKLLSTCEVGGGNMAPYNLAEIWQFPMNGGSGLGESGGGLGLRRP